MNMNEFGAVQYAYDEMAESWDRILNSQRHPWLLPLSLLAKKVDAGAAVLEAGCGVGREAGFFRTYRPDIRYYGVDVSQKSLDIAQRKHPFGTFDQMSITELLYDDSVFHGFLCIAVLQHLSADECQTALQELRRVTLPGSPGFIATAEGHGTEIIEAFQRPDLALPITFWEHDDMSSVLLSLGFAIEDSKAADGLIQFYVTKV